MGQPLDDHVGARRFGGHTPRITGSRVLAAAGMEVNKLRIIARHSGDTILRYVSDAPLKSLRADLGLRIMPGSEPQYLQFMQNGGTSLSAIVSARVQKLEESLARLEGVVQAQA